MRILAVTIIVVSCFLSAGCDIILQPPVQGEWSDFHNERARVTRDARESAEQPAAEKPPAEK
jgi:hypothetical protein